jgi:hypothetical protein
LVITILQQSIIRFTCLAENLVSIALTLMVSVFNNENPGPEKGMLAIIK